MRTVKAQASLRIHKCADPPEPSLLDNATNAKIVCAGSSLVHAYSSAKAYAVRTQEMVLWAFIPQFMFSRVVNLGTTTKLC